MKAWYNSVALHNLGECSIGGESSTFSADLQQKEVRSLEIIVDCWSEEADYAGLTGRIETARAALAVPRQTLKLQDDDQPLEGGGTVPGDVLMERPVEVTGHNLSEVMPGTFRQQIKITFTYEDDLQDTDKHLLLTFQETGAGSPVNLGRVTAFKTDIRTNRYAEHLNLRQRSTGTVSADGELIVNPLDTLTDVRADLLASLELLVGQVDGKDGTLKYGPSGNRFFDKMVQVENFTPIIDQATKAIRWTLQARYTVFPNDSGFAGCTVKIGVSTDKDSGDVTLTLAGRVESNSDTNALAKLTTVRTAALSAHGFTGVAAQRSDLDRNQVDADDGTGFIALDFSELYRKRASNILNSNLTTSTVEDIKTGLNSVTYSGSVVASGATPDAAYATAKARAEVLGKNKHVFKVSSKLTRTDRELNPNPAEHVRLEFEYVYQTKGDTVYLELTTTLDNQQFDDSSETVSGYVVASTLDAAQSAYLSRVKNAYSTRVIRNEQLKRLEHQIQNANKTYSRMGIRLDFQFTVFLPKANGTYQIKYVLKVSIDEVNLGINRNVTGRITGGADVLASVEAGGANVLDTFLASLGLGTHRTSKDRATSKETKAAAGSPETTSIDFDETYVDKLTVAAQVLSGEVSESIRYSTTRWQFQPTFDNADVPQQCGIERGQRQISGTVIANTEAAAMAWIKKQRALPYSSGTGGGTAPATRYEQAPEVTKRWKFLPLEANPVARDIGGDVENFQVIEITFSFTETLLNFPWVEV